MSVAFLIDWSLRHRLLVLAASVALLAGGIVSLQRLPLDALPDLSDVQVIVNTEFPGQSPQLVEDQVTYPLAAALLAVPGTRAVRGFSMFGESFVYLIFHDGTDLYWARTRVQEVLAQARGQLPPDAMPRLGPDASGIGWVYQYALRDRTGRLGPEQLRALQDFHLKLELQSVPGVSEVAAIGGQARQFQIEVDPARLAAHGVGLEQVAAAVRGANRASGGAPLQAGGAEYLLRMDGRLEDVADLAQVGVAAGERVIPLHQLAQVGTGPALRRGIADLDGREDVAAAVVVMRHGANALEVAHAVRARLDSLAKTLPPGVEIVTTYDRAGLIERAIATLRDKLVEESIVVALICGVFLLRLRSALVAIVTLPLGILAALWVMRVQGVSANIMSLGGIAIAVGAMVDAAIVMIENMHRHLERLGEPPKGAAIWPLVRQSAIEVGPALFFSLLIITVSFLPVFTLQGQELRLFAPLAYTKTYAMAASAMLAVTLTPVLMGYLIRGRLRPENANPLNRFLQRLYRPLLGAALRRPRATIALGLVVLASGALPLSRLGSEFMPPLDEGELLYMPTTMPGIGADEAARLLAATDRIIRAMPEVAQVFGKAGRAESATDPAPLSMLETTILLKPRDQWPAGSAPSQAALVEKLDAALRIPGLTNTWGYPIKTRIDMLSTGIRSELGIKIGGPDLAVLDEQARAVERLLRTVPGARSVFADRVGSGRYLAVDIDRAAANRYGLAVTDIQDAVAAAVGGDTIDTIIKGRERYPVLLRYPLAQRQDPTALEGIRLEAPGGVQLQLSQVARLSVTDGPTEIKSENGRPVAYVYVDVASSDAGRFLAAAEPLLDAALRLPPGYTVSWQGQYLQFRDGKLRLWGASLLTLALVAGLLQMHLRSGAKVALVLASLPFAATGGLWLTWLLGFQLSVAVVVGLIALAGVAAEFGIVMLLYLDGALAADPRRPYRALVAGALLRLRPKAMTVAVILGGLIPVMLSDAAGADVMQRIAAPMIGGMLTAPLFSLLVIPAVYRLALVSQACNDRRRS